MWKRLSRSLTTRIFLITSALLLAACGVTYAAIAYLTPISYTSLLEDELRRAGAELDKTLSEGTAEQSEAVLRSFARRTGADMRLETGDGVVFYDTLGADGAVAMAGTAWEVDVPEAAAVEACTVTRVEAEDVMEESTGAREAAAEPDWAVGQVTFAENLEGTFTEEVYAFRYLDGREATLTVRGGMRAVNQTAEAMARLLPGLMLVLLAFSLLGSFFYARYITRPIVEISGLAGRIAGQDFCARWTGRRRDEIGALGESLNRLSDSLSGAMAELRAANGALRRDMERERALERQRLAFFSAASHELKTPLTILRGQLSGMLAQVGVYRDREKYLARALEVSGRMERLVREILTISRIEGDGFEIGDAPVDLSALLGTQIRQDAELMEQRGLRLRTEIAPGVTLRGSESLLASALDNVLMNAILYSSRDAEIWVRLERGELWVENSGAHIPEEALERLFEPFYRVEQSRNRSSGGSGLGLYLVRSILRLHGADCAMVNTPRGVRFSARFGACSESPSGRILQRGA